MNKNYSNRRSDRKKITIDNNVSENTLDAHWRKVYVERDAELKQLTDAWQKVDCNNPEDVEPQLITICADSGVGKTRLVHRFYEWLVEHKQGVDTGYWPSTMGRKKNAFMVNPNRGQCTPNIKPNFLWWGVQMPDQSHNSKTVCSSVLGSYVSTLAAHTPNIRIAREAGEAYSEIREGAGELAFTIVNEIVSQLSLVASIKDFGSAAFTLSKGIKNAIKSKNEKKEQDFISLDQLEKKEIVELADNIANDLAVVLSEHKDVETIPMVFFVDDAQWMQECDQYLKELLETVIKHANLGNWPIMIVLTHWQTEWNADNTTGNKKGVPALLDKVNADLTHVSTLKRFKEGKSFGEVLPLSLFDLSPILKVALPGVNDNEQQHKRLIGEIKDGRPQGDAIIGNARHLDEFLMIINRQQNQKYFKTTPNQNAIDNCFIDNWEQDIEDELGSLGYNDLIKYRFSQLDEAKRHILSFSAYQGITFPEILTEALYCLLVEGATADQCGWNDIENPQNFIQRSTQGEGLSTFPDHHYRNVAHKANIFPEDTEDELRILLANWLTNGFFEESQGVVTPSADEEEVLCKIALKVFKDWNIEEINSLNGLAYARLFKINNNRQNPKEAVNYALKFAQGVIQAQQLDLDNIKAGKVFDIIYTLYIWNHLQEAQDFAQIALKAYENLNAPVMIIAKLNNSLGEIAKANNDLNLALSRSTKFLILSEKINALGETPDTLAAVAVANSRLGKIAQTNNDLNLALGYFEKGLALSEQVNALTETPDTLIAVAWANYSLGKIAQANNDLDLALSYFKQFLTLSEQVNALGETPDTLSGVAAANNSLGEIAKANNDLNLALDYFEKGLTLSEQVNALTETPDTLKAVAFSNGMLGGIAQAKNDLDLALSYFEKGLTQLEKVNTLGETLETLKDLTIANQRLGGLAQAKNDQNLAFIHYEKYIEALGNLAIKNSKLGGRAQDNNDLSQAFFYLKQSASLFKEINTLSETPETLKNLAVSNYKLGNLAQANNDLDLALSYFEQYLALSEQVNVLNETSTTLRDLIFANEKLGDLAKANNDLDLALSYFEQYLVLSEQVNALSETPDTLRDIAAANYKLGGMAQANNDRNKAFEYFEISETILRKIGTTETDDMADYIRSLIE
jgi:tetratricopeptide (TPR) repeat protein